MEIRDIEIFLTLAQELHFGRTAKRLYVTPARVSQAIKKQERGIGGALFERTSHHVRLTPLGQQLYDDLLPAYRGLRQGLERAALTARGKPDVLRLGMISSNTGDLRPVLAEFAARRPGCTVQIRAVPYDGPFAHLRAGTVDVLLVWLPIEEPDLTVGPVVCTEPVVLVVSANHRLAVRDSVSYEDLADEPVVTGAAPAYWREALIPTRTPSGRPIPAGPAVVDGTQLFAVVATGEAVCPAFAHGLRYYSRPDIAYIPIRDAPLSRWAFCWRSDAETDAIRALASVAADLGPLAL
ncbi:LysR family transcriptional regulator [Streptomyces lancefieldiae]|uniref:LysR family transcriptional regulator n=1 Tax=Streptomyces lancefieldiae TaxID=3075520 RepID=A0ABU3ASZ4_9ACTN|nr:LysR family transcriptional regulator [Streptomyces sp. DSM 40712]MDT0612178.1 LysR family transcriptional regulator [Streptomyces sp. DSM 40712]